MLGNIIEYTGTSQIWWEWFETQKYQLEIKPEQSENKGEWSVSYPWNKKMPAFLKALGMLVFQIQYKKTYFAPI